MRATFFKAFLSTVFLYASTAFADVPMNGCRVKTETFKKHGTEVNNAGCVLGKKDGNDYKFLMVYVNKKEGKDKGWGFPGGKPSTAENDKKEGSSIAETVKFDYVEPAVCTAVRETREEVGIEVVVGDLIETQKKFIAFDCFAADPKELEKTLTPLDTKEVKKVEWISWSAIKKDPKMLRFESNLSIAENWIKRQSK